MKNALQILTYEDKPCRMTLLEGEPWWVAKDVCDILEIKFHRDAVSRLDDDERGSVVVDTLGGSQTMSAVNESGLYSLIFDSRKPEAKKFKRWVTHEVLPTIRRTGVFALAGAMPLEQSKALAAQLRSAAAQKRLEAAELECRAKLALTVEGAMPIIEWIDAHCTELNPKQRANASRSIKRALINQLGHPVGVTTKTDGTGNKVMSALPCDIAEAVELLKPTRKELN